MPYNGSGTFTPYTPGNPAVPGTVISSTAYNSTQSDIAAGLSNAVTRDGQSPPSDNLPMGGKKLTGLAAGAIAGDSLRWEQLFSQGTEQDLASAATTDVGAQNTTVLRITGTTGITSFGTNYNGPRFVRFADVLTLTHNATTLILPTSANITTAAGDRAILTPVGNPASGWQVLVYQRANGALIGTLPATGGGTGSTLGVRNYIAGLTMSTAGSSATMSVAAGQAADANGSLMDLASSISKTTSAWAVGSTNGGKLSAAAIANNTWYYFYLIRRPDTGVVDVGFDVSATSPTLPTNYTQYRYIGAALTNGSAQWVKFYQIGDKFLWDAPVLDVNAASSGTSAVTRTLTTPRRVTSALIVVNASVTGAVAFEAVRVSPLFMTDSAPTNTASPGADLSVPNSQTLTAEIEVATNTSAQVRSRQLDGSASSTLRIITRGWVDTRGRDE